MFNCHFVWTAAPLPARHRTQRTSSWVIITWCSQSAAILHHHFAMTDIVHELELPQCGHLYHHLYHDEVVCEMKLLLAVDTEHRYSVHVNTRVAVGANCGACRSLSSVVRTQALLSHGERVRELVIHAAVLRCARVGRDVVVHLLCEELWIPFRCSTYGELGLSLFNRFFVRYVDAVRSEAVGRGHRVEECHRRRDELRDLRRGQAGSVGETSLSTTLSLLIISFRARIS